MYDIDEAKRINEYLNLQEHNLSGQPIFRLVWANDQFELRHGEFNEFKGSLFVRTVYGVKKSLKYPFFQGCWVLEEWFSPEKLQSFEIKNHNGYEAIYSFRAKINGKFQPLPLRKVVVELIMKAKHAHVSKMRGKSALIQGLEDKEAALDKYTYDAIDSPTDVAYSLKYGEAISLAGLEIPNAESKQDISPITSKSGK